MMGERRVAQDSLFYEFNLEGHVPANHLLRSIDRFVDLTGLRQHLSAFCSTTGRPSIDPELNSDASGRILLRDPLRTPSL